MTCQQPPFWLFPGAPPMSPISGGGAGPHGDGRGGHRILLLAGWAGQLLPPLVQLRDPAERVLTGQGSSCRWDGARGCRAGPQP